MHAGHSVLTKSQVLDSLKMFFPHITAREVRSLVGSGNLSMDKLKELLFETETPVSDNPEAAGAYRLRHGPRRDSGVLPICSILP